MVSWEKYKILSQNKLKPKWQVVEGGRKLWTCFLYCSVSLLPKNELSPRRDLPSHGLLS
jgi:hypothetical protein